MYGEPEVAESPVSMDEFDWMKESVGFTDEDKVYLEQAGEFLPTYVDDLFERWRDIFGEIFMSTFVGPDGEATKSTSSEPTTDLSSGSTIRVTDPTTRTG